MTSLRRRILLDAAKVFDLVLMVFSFGLATMLVARETPAVSLTEFLSMRIKVSNFVLFAGFLLVWHVVFCSFGVYSSKRLSARWAEVLDIAKAATLGSAIIFVAAMPLRIRLVTPLFILFFWISSVLGGAASRVVLRGMLGGIRRRGRNLREMVVVGTNPHGKFVLRDRHRIMIDFWGSGRPLASGRFSPSAYGQAWRIGEYRSPATDGCEGS